MSAYSSCAGALNPDLQMRAMIFKRQDTRVSGILYAIYKNDNKDTGTTILMRSSHHCSRCLPLLDEPGQTLPQMKLAYSGRSSHSWGVLSGSWCRWMSNLAQVWPQSQSTESYGSFEGDRQEDSPSNSVMGLALHPSRQELCHLHEWRMEISQTETLQCTFQS
jgi:hypothetical protein